MHLVKVVNTVEDDVDVFLRDDGLRDCGEGEQRLAVVLQEGEEREG